MNQRTARTSPVVLGVACAAALALGTVPAAAVPAAPAAAPGCRGEAVATLRPGLSVKPNNGTVYARGGTIDCDTGKVLGRAVTGPGTYDAAARYGTGGDASCVGGGTGWMVQTITFPTADGPFVVQSTATYTFGALTEDGLLTGRFRGDYLDGVFSMLPRKGDCVTAPVTAGGLTFTANFHPYRSPS